jgi:hypothetical protein
MRSYRLLCLGAVGMVVALVGCSGGDLTRPGQGAPGAPPPATVVVVSGDGQRGETGTVLDMPLTVQVLDDSLRPVPGTAVHFGFLGDFSGAALDPTSVLTDADGRAAAIVRLGQVVGEQVVVAEVANTQLPDLRAQFTATAVAPDSGGGGKRGGGGGHGGEGGD